MTILPGCAVPYLGEIGVKNQSREDIAHYVEDVFRLQNNMTSEVMMLIENNDINNPDKLLQAEQQMQQMCKPLNEYVSREVDGLKNGFFLRWRLEESAKDCEQAAQHVKSLLIGL
ncbi:MAG: hypothetical protein ACXW1W_07515 [Methylococcaceae bacterium]